eukprot:TRINITY_DN1445_c0_g1_i3.p1 TRINITY_DN1445_c0_g1~~TRINITY_DN1445_c0_g1_i3.p1  ORF type:complete len:139 (+),score=11.62 TRINITY_DN1445_c0_g1_i3:232-648(+)
MEFAATQLYIATGDNSYLTSATKFASSYINDFDGTNPMNLYDIGGLAHFELARLLKSRESTNFELGPNDLIANLKAGLDQAVSVGNRNPFYFGISYSDEDDNVPECIGLAIMAGFYRILTGSSAYEVPKFIVRRKFTF